MIYFLKAFIKEFTAIKQFESAIRETCNRVDIIYQLGKATHMAIEQGSQCGGNEISNQLCEIVEMAIFESDRNGQNVSVVLRNYVSSIRRKLPVR